MSEYSTVIYSVENNVARITLNRPDNLNGITNTMMRELYECTGRAAEDDEVRVVLLTGAGRGFCRVQISKPTVPTNVRSLTKRSTFT
jgi:enoyl-CoA hydratase/carnithine racemase